MNIYSDLYYKIDLYRKNFENLLCYLDKEHDLSVKYDIARFASEYFTEFCTGYFTSTKLEQFFLEYAKTIKIDIDNIAYQRKSVIHIMSQAYHTGGHTRVVERWIENAEEGERHSVLFTSQNSREFKVLAENIAKTGGEYILFGDIPLIDKVQEIRKICMQYEYIILHTHMDDPIPILAFGVKEFSRPVFFYNHASHRPWIGKCIADLVIDLKKDDPVTNIYRSIHNVFNLGVPSKPISLNHSSKDRVRKTLGIPLDQKVIVTSGGESRYKTICSESFIKYLESILDEDTLCYVIGISSKSHEWQDLASRSNGKVKLLGFIDFDKGYTKYLQAADLYLDSYPLCGGTACIDAISFGAPVLTLNCPYPQFDYLAKTSGFCLTSSDFIYKAKKVLNDQSYAEKLLSEQTVSLIQNQSPEAWRKKIQDLYRTAPKQHMVQDLSNEIDYAQSNDLCVLCNAVYVSRFLQESRPYQITKASLSRFKDLGVNYKSQGIPYILEVKSFKKHSFKARVIKLFGIEIYTKKKVYID